MKKKILVSIIIIISIFITFLNTVVYATDKNIDYLNLPSSYDLRNDISIRVENQGQRGWCNAYSTTKIIETYLQKTKGINYNLSEAYMAYSNVKYFGGVDDWKTSSEINETPVYYEGGKLTLESDFPNRDYVFTEANKQKFDNTRPVIKCTKNKYLGSSEEIKNYIMNYGAVHTSAYSGDSKAKYEWYNTNSAICCVNNSNQNDLENGIGHAVVIIGWNDNYSRNNFKSSNRPSNNGAWLVLNSWGTDWANGGTAWVSYEDAYVGKNGTYGIEEVKLAGEINAEFSYEMRKIGSSVYAIAYIRVDDKIENVEGWSESNNQYNGSLISRNFEEAFEPYNIEIKSSVDGSTRVVEVNIPKEEFEKLQNQAQREKDEQKKQTKKSKIRLYISLSIYYVICIIILILIIKLRKIYKEQNDKEIKSKSVLEKCVDVICKIIKLTIKIFFIILGLIIFCFVVLFILALFIT